MIEQPFGFAVPTAVRFGDGVSRELPQTLPAGARTIAVVRGGSGTASGPLVDMMRNAGLIIVEHPCPGEPSVASVNTAVSKLSGRDIDAVVAIGGGAVLDSAKAIAFCLGHGVILTEDFTDIPAPLLKGLPPLPLIAVPTTAGTGAEVTANAVLELPSQHAKVSLRGRALIPANALVDPLLLPSAPAATVLASGLDAVVQTIEAYTSCVATPFSDALTAPNVALGLRALRDVIETSEPSAWRCLAWVSHTSGIALANGGLGAAHGVASVLGGRTGAPHGALCGRLIVPVLRQNIAAAPSGSRAAMRHAEVAAHIAAIFPPASGQDAFSGLELWQEAQGLPRLADFGVQTDQIENLAEHSAAASSSQKNALPLPVAAYAEIIRAAL
jgi:alcohol dehydrogenase class IV